MSGGGPKKKPTKGHGWEEAGAEFYQESYPTDAEFDVLQRDPKHLATLLPSKQTRGELPTLTTLVFHFTNLPCCSDHNKTEEHRYENIQKTDIVEITQGINNCASQDINSCGCSGVNDARFVARHLYGTDDMGGDHADQRNAGTNGAKEGNEGENFGECLYEKDDSFLPIVCIII